MKKIITDLDDVYSKIESLKKVKVDNWTIYYLDESNGEKWITERPHPELQAGGPLHLRLIDKYPWE